MPRIRFSGLPLGQPVSLQVSLDGTSRAASVPAWGMPPDYFPTSLALSARALRMNVLDLSGFGTADAVTVATPSGGRLVPRGGQRFGLDLTAVAETAPVSFGYVASKAGRANIAGTCTVSVSPASEMQGWGVGRHPYWPTDPVTGRFLIEPGRTHRKVHIAPTGWSKAQIEAANGIPNASGSWLRDNVAPVAHGGDGTVKYGETPATALDEDRGQQLWNTISAVTVGPNSNWLLFQRGGTFPLFSFSGDGRRGESPLHPMLVGAWGSGPAPVLGNPPKFQPGFGRCVVVQDIRMSPGTESFQHAQLSWVALDGFEGAGDRGEITGNTATTNFVARGITIRRTKLTDVTPEVSVNGPGATWAVKSDRVSSYFTSGFDGLLIEKFVNDISGWGTGYDRLTFSSNAPQPPSSYSHCVYLSNLAGTEDPDNPDSGGLGGCDVTVRDSLFARGSLTGIQFRPGGICYDSLFVRSNLGLFFGGGGVVSPGVEQGNYCLALGNLFTEAGQKDGQNAMSKGKAISTGAPDTALVGNIVAHSGGGEDGVTAWGAATGSELAVDVDAPEGSLFADDTRVRGWIAAGNDRNLAGLSLATLDATTIGAYTDSWKAVSGSGYKDFLGYLRAEAAPWERVPAVLSWFRGPFQVPQAGHAPTLVTFRPDAAGRGPGNRWDIRLDWDIGDVPRDGDSVNLAGHRVFKFDNTALAGLDLGSGTLQQFGGRTSVSGTLAGAAGAGVVLEGSGQFHCTGYAGSAALAITARNGRFLNGGSFTGPADLTFSAAAEAILGYGTAALTVASGRRLTLHGGRVAVGADGAAGSTATLTLAAGSLLEMRSVARVLFSGRRFTVADFRSGMTVGNGTWSGIVDDKEDLPISVAAGGLANEVGAVWLRELTGGMPAAGDALNGEGWVLFSRQPAGTIATATQVSASLPRIARVRSGVAGTTAPGVTFNVSLAGALAVDATGMAPGSYPLIEASAITGTFSGVTVTGGSGTVSYSTTQVMLTIV
jgi:hypothetical protein